MKDSSIINKLKRVQKEADTLGEELSISINRKFDVDFKYSDTFSTIKNDFYSANIWYLGSIDEIKETSCHEMPSTEKEVLELSHTKSKSKENIEKAHEYMIKILEESK